MEVMVRVDPQDVLDEFTDDDLLAEMASRGISSGPKAPDVRSAVSMVSSDLMSRRVRQAREGLMRIVAMHCPPEIVDALEALDRGAHSDAICVLDRLLEPAPSALEAVSRKPSR